MFYHAPRQRSPVRNIFQENVVHSKIVCLENDQALLWPQYSVQTSTTTPQRRVIEELVQYLLNPADSAVIVKPVPIRKDRPTEAKPCLTTLPSSIHEMITEYLSDYDTLCLAISSRDLFNKSIERMQSIVCPLQNIGCWSGKALVRADPSNPTPTATAVEAQYLDKTTDATIITPALRSNETLYLASFPDKRLVLHGIAHDMHIPQIIRRFVSAALRNKEYENLFIAGEESTVVDVGEFKEGEETPMVEILHEAEVLLDAISCAPEDTFSKERFEKGSWAGCRVDIVSKKRVDEEEGWKLAEKSDVTRPYNRPEDCRGRYFKDGNGALRDRSRSGSMRRDKSVGKRNRMYSFLGKEKFMLPCQPRVLVDGRIMWA
ncbi:hypothetical protein TWF191_008727 [Orbilia oligospora]|uniref:F-box domain-containing protein n=1 Tax=Orbilia oligospora TaxID=2813651 RepID=A0A7C8VFP7_ORBOL|nr:hypothetical protein TWF191_008727 [Orbilia oligospora]